VFERFTEKARRSLFFARYEASVFGSSSIESYHLLLGILLEYPVFARGGCARDLRDEIEQKVGKGPGIPTSVDLPLSHDAKRVLARAAEQADVMGHLSIEGGHLLLAMMWREHGLAGELLQKYGIDETFVKSEMPPAQEPLRRIPGR
jgi:ATP-dependent Clp protease ATP-binding subunit ClpC